MPALVLRPYQQLAIDAFERDRAAGRTSTHIVSPPGSGKTVVGLEIVRRLGRPALVLAPTATIQAQWADKQQLFEGDSLPELTVLTYQAICQTADPGGALRDAALAALVVERSQATGTPPTDVAREMAGFEGAAKERLEKDVGNEVARLKRAVARGEHVDVDLATIVAPAARERVRQLVAGGVGTLVLDECHHLASLWGYLVRVLVGDLGAAVHVVGLTATSPHELTGEEAELYSELLGPVDFEIPTPAVVRDGHLAPYQELARFTTPLQSERQWLAERHVRFAELIDSLHDDTTAALAFGPWVIGRIRYRDTGDGRARVPFATLAAKRPDLARAGLRYLGSAGLELPDDAPRGEGWREPPTLEDWLVLISDYAIGCLRAHPGDAAEQRLETLSDALRDLGFLLTRQGVRRGGSDVDRVLTTSAAKPLAAVEILAAEAETRGDAMRAVVLTDAEHAERRDADTPLALTGGARGVLATLSGDDRTAVLRPLLVTGQTVACLRRDAAALAAALGATGQEEQDGVTLLTKPGWDSRTWVAAAGRALAAGETQCVVGTRGLLGEGWDAPVLNVLIDLTSVAADVSVRQMRGRALRLDPGDAEKVASNWDVVCVAADLARGTADYERFVRRHTHLHAPCEDGSIETGVSHVHPLLSPYTAPSADQHEALNASTLARGADHLGARTRWKIGEPYVSEDVPVLLVGRARRDGEGGGHGAERETDRELLLTAPGTSGAGAPPPPAGPFSFMRLKRLGAAYPEVLPLDGVARAVAVVFQQLGEITPEAAQSLALTPREGGLVRCALSAGDADENARFTAALEEAINPALGQRYVVSRPVWPAGRSRRAVAWRGLTRRAPLDVAWHPVPSSFGSHKQRADGYHAAWQANVGPGELLFAGREGAEGREGLAAAAAESAGYVTSRRTMWH